MNLIIAQVQRTMEGGDGSANKKPAVDKGTLYNMRCHVSDKTAYAEEEQLAAKGVEAKKPASSDNDDDKDSPTPASGKNVDKAPKSPSYSPCLSESEDDTTMAEKDPKDAVEDPSKTSPPKDDTRKAQPVPKNDDAVSKPRSLQKVKKTVDKHGYSVVDPPNQVPKKSPPKDDTPVPKKADSASKPRSKDSVSKDNEIVDKFGYVVVDPPKEFPKKSAEVIDELREEYDWYKLQDKDKDLEFIDMVNRHASSLTLT